MLTNEACTSEVALNNKYLITHSSTYSYLGTCYEGKRWVRLVLKYIKGFLDAYLNYANLLSAVDCKSAISRVYMYIVDNSGNTTAMSPVTLTSSWMALGSQLH